MNLNHLNDNILSDDELDQVQGGARDGSGIIKKYFAEAYKRCPKCHQKKLVKGRCLECGYGTPNPRERA